MEMTLTKRKAYMDFLRIISSYMVLFNHTGTKGFVLFTTAQNHVLYPFYLINAIFIKIAVPLFFMVSGALMLGREESYKKVLMRFFRFFFLLIGASFLLYLYRCFRVGDCVFSIKEFIVMAYQKPIVAALWYLYAYLAYILMLPVLRCFVKSMDTNAFRWMLAMYGLISLLPVAEFALKQGEYVHYSRFTFFISVEYFIYPIMGYYIDHVLEEDQFTWSRLLRLTAASVLAIGLCACLTHWRCTLLGEWKEKTCQTFFNTLIFIPAGTVFYAARMLFIRHEPGDRLKRWLAVLSSLTFGLYLFEYIYRRETQPVFNLLRPVLHTLPACWVWIAVACLFGMAVTWILKKLPGLRKLI